ncbi:WavE lipopolysaccharide synthesis family protein [Tianweitania sp.]|uniref:WavE lipopolysaccharide synthesis family protein n=1 Tax=Tianweitania sp. TaxID=2021634 RepID=UPI00289C7CBB|nr:WavE lipopolysaccharide synthesis family protein [Tianweitania sp.]
MPIQDADITFVVQGPVSQGDGSSTREATASIRRFFPGSRIVLSTWENEDTRDIDADETVFSADPGGILWEADGVSIVNNVNRQILSTRVGLARVKTPYAAKLRSDGHVTGRGFISLEEAFPTRLSEGTVFERRIVVSKEFTRSARSFIPMAYHPSDLFQFGLTADLRRYWDAELLAGESLSGFMLNEAPDVWYRMFDRFRFTTEQYLFLSALKRSGHERRLTHYAEINEHIIADSERMLFNNFIPCEPEVLGIDHERFRGRAQKSLAEDCVGLREFLAWYLDVAVAANSRRMVGTPAPRMSLLLRTERVAREILKRSQLMRRLYAGQFLKR